MCAAWQRLFHWASKIRGVCEAKSVVSVSFCPPLQAGMSVTLTHVDTFWHSLPLGQVKVCHVHMMRVWGERPFHSRRFPEASRGLDFAARNPSTCGESGWVQLHLRAGLLEWPHCDPWYGILLSQCVRPVLLWRRAWFNDQQLHYQSTCWYCRNSRASSVAPLAQLISCFHHEYGRTWENI